MLKRNIALLIAGALFGAQVGLASADQSPFPSSAPEAVGSTLPAQAANYLEPRGASNQAASAARRAVKITPSTTYVNVEHEEIVTIENAKGQRFVWKADTQGEADIPLQQIAPRDFAVGQARIFVSHPYAHLRTN